jgi:hypothetical protein
MPLLLHAKNSLLTEENRQKLPGFSVIKQFEFEEVVTMSVFSLLSFGHSGKMQVNSEIRCLPECVAAKCVVLFTYMIHKLTINSGESLII